MSETRGTAETRSRTPPKQKARELGRHLRGERPDYAYLKQVFRHLRAELEVEIPRAPKRLPHVPSEEEMRRYYQTVWQARNFGDMVLIKTLLYTGVRVSELVNISLADVDLDRCQIRINEGKGKKDRMVPFPDGFKETLGMHMAGMRGSTRPTCSSRRGRSGTAIAGCAGCWNGMPRPPGWSATCRRTNSGISC